MSKVKIQGNASGTGILTIAAPNTNTDRTITLPDGTGTLLTGTVSALDPAIDTNPLATGHYWVNKTSGECYVCTDITTDANVWMNIGEGSGSVPLLGSQSNPAASAGAIDAAGAWNGDGFYYITTDNGVKETYCIKDDLGAYMVIGKFAADAADNIAATISTANETIQDSTATKWSCNFGNMIIDEIRFIGVNSIEGDWADNRNIDFIHGIDNKSFKSVMHQIGNGPTVTGTGSAKYGYTCTYAKDGYGRWTNNSYVHHRISDGAGSVSEGAFTAAGSFNIDTADDGKFTAHHTYTYSGQDTEFTVGFGHDDNIVGFSDEYPNTADNMGGGRDYATAVYVLIRAT